MATTVTAATLSVTITEALTLNGVDQGGSHVLSVASVANCHRRIMTCIADTDIEVLNIASTVDGLSVAGGAMKHLRITNLDMTQYVQVIIDAASTNSLAFKLEAGRSFMWGIGDSSMTVNDSAAITGAATLASLEKITIRAYTDNVDVEIFTAGT